MFILNNISHEAINFSAGKAQRAFYYFPPLFRIRKQNHSLKTMKSDVRLRFNANLQGPLDISARQNFTKMTFLDIKFFITKMSQILNATKIVRFRKTFKIWAFFEKKSLRKNLEFCQNC